MPGQVSGTSFNDFCKVSHKSHSIEGLTAPDIQIIQSEKLENKQISSEIADKNPRLLLEVIEGPYLLNTKINIDARGIMGNVRHDGITYFGQSLSSEFINNDFNFPEDENGVGKRHLLIKFNEKTSQYILRDLSDGTGTFIKITTPYKLSNGTIISFCDNHLSFSYDKISQLAIFKFLEGCYANEKKAISLASSPIILGREPSCTIAFQATSLSRKQCMIYRHNDDIFLEDGDGKNGSTNGTWVFVDVDIIIENGLIFKAGQSLFKASIVSSKK